MSTGGLERLLQEQHGLRLDATTRPRLARVLADEARRLGRTPEDHAAHLEREPAAQPGFLDRLTLQESSFFRDPAVFDALRDELLPAAIRAAGDGPVTVWSAGCAHGQEAWSVAMLLTELGPPNWSVVGSDLSGAAAVRAQSGTYAPRELRGLSDARRARFLAPEGRNLQIVPELRHRVRFVQRNAATEPAPLADGACALVLCRYVLIYLTPAAARGLLAEVERVLTPGGRLVIGAAESLWHVSDRFVLRPSGDAMTYALRGAGAPGGGDAAPGFVPAARAPVPTRAPRAAARPIRVPRAPAPTTPPPDRATLLATGEAAVAAEDLPGAVAAFRAAAYLDPDDAVALLQLGLVLEELGDPGAHRAFRAAAAALDRRAPAAREQALGGFQAQELTRLLAAKLRTTTPEPRP